jgi:choline dehydrogenase-like flavoprotein
MAPIVDNWIGLDTQRPRPDGRPGLILNIRLPQEAKVALESARDDLLGVLSRVGLEPRVRLWNLSPACDSVHYGGTCRMHASPRFGMVDARGRLHTVPNVAVADSAAFTTGPEKNPVLTSMALAARASNRLAEELAAGDL